METKACFICKGNNHDFTRQGFLKCPARDKIRSKFGIHYKDTERCKNTRATHSRVKKSRTPRNEKHKPVEASEVKEFETSSISTGGTG